MILLAAHKVKALSFHFLGKGYSSIPNMIPKTPVAKKIAKSHFK